MGLEGMAHLIQRKLPESST